MVVDELRGQPELATIAKNLETSYWRMYKMRRRFMDGCDAPLFQGKSDAKTRKWDNSSDTDDMLYEDDDDA